jgi:hypothetical protein
MGLIILSSFLPGTAYAADIPADFNLQVTPSPLVTSVKPGVKSTVELKVHNGGSGTENLKIEPRSFKFDSNTGKVSLDDTATPPVAPWISFSAPKFSVAAGQTFPEQIALSFPKEAGFSYSFALLISRQVNPKPTNGQRAINGSLAVFTLVNVDRPGAKSSLQVVSYTTTKHLYEYLPSTVSVRFHNNGNTIVQPLGNIFIQRTAGGKKPLATLVVNQNQGYILPDTERTFSTNWDDGFATYQPVTQSDGSVKQQFQIDWSKLSHFRIGRYTANLVAVYSDGKHDIPVEGTVSFWVVPWRAILLFIALVVGLWFFTRWRSNRRTEKAVKRALAAHEAATKAKEKAEERKP